MNKRLIALTLITLLLLPLAAGCAKKPAYKDGDYTAANPDYDSYGYKAQMSLTIKGDKITAVNYDEVNKNGSKKSTDPQYAANMKAKVNITPPETYTKLTNDLISKQDPTKVDKITGATETSAYFKNLSSEALAKAKNQ